MILYYIYLCQLYRFLRSNLWAHPKKTMPISTPIGIMPPNALGIG